MTVQTGRRARKQPAEVRRETILDAAIAVFARTAYRAAGTAEIARAAGIAEPTLYRHFSSKRELYLAALEQTGELIVEKFREIATRTEKAEEALSGMGDWYAENVAVDPEHLRLRQRAYAETDDHDVRAALQRVYLAVQDIAAGVIRRGQEQGVFTREVSPEAGAWLFIAIGQVLDLGRLIGLSPEECLRSCDELAHAAKRALAVHPA